MTPVEQLVQASEAAGLVPIERCEGTDGARKIFAFSATMPKSVRELGWNIDGLSYNYWRAGSQGIRESFSDFDRLQEIEFPADLRRWLQFYVSYYKLQWKFWRDDWLVAKLKREWRKTGAPKPYLNSDLVGPGTGEYQKIEAASSLISDKLSEAAQQLGFKLYWSWGDSSVWRVIIAIPTESELTKFVANVAHREFAREIIGLIGTVITLTENFKLYMELDSDERVNAADGWFLRIKGEPLPGREYVVGANIESLMSA